MVEVFAVGRLLCMEIIKIQVANYDIYFADCSG